jgi:hypothetical protein
MRATFPAAKVALRDMLSARTGMAGVLVQLHLPTRVPTQRDRVYVVGTENFARVPSDQQGGMVETYLLVLLVEARRNGTDAQPAADRLAAMIDELDQLLVDDEELGGVVYDSRLAAIPAENTLPLPDNTGWLARAEVHVHVEVLV